MMTTVFPTPAPPKSPIFPLFDEGGCSSVKRSIECHLLVDEDGSFFVHWLTDDVDETSEGKRSNWYLDWFSTVFTDLTTYQTVSGFHCNRTYSVLSEMLCYFENKAVVPFIYNNLEGIKNFG